MMAFPSMAADAWVRPALPADVPAMAELINGYARQELMLPKTPEQLYARIRDYRVVVDLAGGLAACGGLRVYSGDSAEIVGLAVDAAWQGRGLGGVLVDRLVEDARGLGIPRVFAMTLSEPFFTRHGFRTLPRSALPEKERADCAACPRRVGCREIAVQRLLAQDADGVPKADSSREKRASGRTRARPRRESPVRA